MKGSYTSMNSSINGMHVRDSRNMHENIYCRNNNHHNALGMSPNQRSIV